MRTREFLVKAKDLLVTKGWNQNFMATDGAGHSVLATVDASTFCAVGACSAAYRSNPASAKVWNDAENLLDEVAGGNVVEFNDTPGRTLEEVLAVFDAAIAQCPEEQ